MAKLRHAGKGASSATPLADVRQGTQDSRMPPSRRRRYFFYALYLGFLLVLLEGSARLAFRVPALSSRLSVGDGLDWRRQWVARRRDAGKQFRFGFDAYDSTKGWKSRSNVRGMKVFNDKVLNTNAQGFRDLRDYAYARDTGKVRILLLGDSFTFGEAVSDDEMYASLLQRMLPGAEILNFGVHGYAHDQMLILLREQGIRYRPDIVMLGFISDDMSRNLVDFRDYAKPHYSIDNGALRLEGSPVPPIEQLLKWDWARPRLVDVAAVIRAKLTTREARTRKREELTAAILSEMIRVTDSIRATPMFVYLPIGKEIAVRSDSTEDERWFSRMCREHRTLKCFSALPQFQEEIRKGTTFKTRGHWDPAGHAVVAKAIERYLSDSGFVRRP